MLTKRQYQILNSCADDWELFYFPFAWVNYGGVVLSRRAEPFMRAVGERVGIHARPDPSRFEDQGVWRVSVTGHEIAEDVHTLLASGMLKVQRIGKTGEREIVGPSGLSKEEMAVYDHYDCLTFEDHLEIFDYGPHEFMISEVGLQEIEQSAYRDYDKQLGWI